MGNLTDGMSHHVKPMLAQQLEGKRTADGNMQPGVAVTNGCVLSSLTVRLRVRASACATVWGRVCSNRAYVIKHPDDRVAFHVFVDRFTSEAASETFDLPTSKAEVEEVNRLIRQKLKQA